MTPPERHITIVVTPQIKKLFDGVDVKGDGGFQSLIRFLIKKLKTDESVIRFTADEFKRVVTYSVNYGEGGYQARLRILIAHWTNQHFNELVKCMS